MEVIDASFAEKQMAEVHSSEIKRRKSESRLIRELSPQDAIQRQQIFAKIQSFCEELVVCAGQYLWHEGEAGGYLGLITQGEVTASKIDSFGNYQILVGTHKPGSILGEESFLTKEPHSLTIKAITDTHLLVLSLAGFNALEQQSPLAANEVLIQAFKQTTMRQRFFFERLAGVF